jgi:hypothetical protein
MPIAQIPAWPSVTVVGISVALGILCLSLSGCPLLSRDTVLYRHDGIEVGLQPDPSITRSTPPAPNAHPASFSAGEIAVLLGAIRVSGWSGTLVGFLETPRPIPLFEDTELQLLAAPIAEAFGRAAPAERVFFFLPNPKSPYGDATAGFLFARDAFVHVVVTDHKAFARADTGGGEEKDPRDMKGMKLWISAPYRPADVPASQEPDWAPFETVHVSLNKDEVLARGRRLPGAATLEQADPRTRPTPSDPFTSDAAASREAQADTTSEQELRLQIRELTQSNLDLRERLTQQTQQLKELKDELVRLRRELDRAKPKSPGPKKPPP